MKKTILIILLLTPLIFRMVNSSQEALLVKVEAYGFSKKEKNINWEYVKDKLFEGKINRNPKVVIKKISGPILFTLKNATKQDSLAINTIIETLKK